MTPIKFALKSVLLMLMLALAGEARANFVLNGDFSNFTLGNNNLGQATPGQLGDSTTIANWSSGSSQTDKYATNLFYESNMSTTVGSYNPENKSYCTLYAPNGSANINSPTGDNFVALDGDSKYRGTFSQTITGLVMNQAYTLTFDWAGAEQTTYSALSNDTLNVSLGSSTQMTTTVTNQAGGFTGWMSTTMTFTAGGSSQLLSFLAVSTPDGEPPYILLSNVSLNSVPEPSTIALVSIGTLVFFGADVRRRWLAKRRKA